MNPAATSETACSSRSVASTAVPSRFAPLRLAAFLALVVPTSCSPRVTTQEVDAFFHTPKSVDLGLVRQGDVINHTFELRNPFPEPLFVKRDSFG